MMTTMKMMFEAICGVARHSVDAFQPPSRSSGVQSSEDASEAAARDATLPNIVRPSYNDLRSADDTLEGDDVEDGSSEQVSLLIVFGS